MPYTNTIVTTSTGGTWDSGTGLSYSTISLIDGIPHSAQLEVERVFTVPRDTTNYATIEDFLNNSATTQKDKQQVFVIPASRITFNETSKTITAIDLPSTGNTYDFNPDGAGLANVPVPAIVSGTSVLKVRRKTVSNETLVNWSAGSKLTSAQLNLEVKQLLYLIQELVDKTTTEVNVSNTTIGTVTNYSITPIKLSAGAPAWLSSGNVGIGTTNPQAKLTVSTQNPTNGIAALITNSSTSSHTGTQIQLTQNTIADWVIGQPSGVNAFAFWSDRNTSAAGNERMRIDSSGNLILGNVTAAGDATRNLDIYNYATGASAASMIRLITHNTAGSPSSIGQLIKYQTGAFAIQNTDTNAAAHIRFDVGSSERMRIDSSGRVGIGMTPTTRLFSLYSAATPTLQIVNSTTGTDAGDGGIIYMSGYDMLVTNQESANLKLETGGSTRLTISSSGDVGIGTTTPLAKLMVSTQNPTNGIVGLITNSSTSSHTGTQIQLTQNTVADWVIGQPAGVNAFAFWNGRNTSNSGTERMRIDSNGNVGIGTASPTTKLDVNGTINASSIKINGPVSADVNTLDRYEEKQILLASTDFGGDTTLGTYTINTTSNPSFIQVTSIGDRVMVDGIVTLTAITTAGTGPIRISNTELPDIDHGLGWLTCYFVNLAVGAAINLVGYYTGKKIYFYLTKAAAASMTALAPGDLTATTQIRFCGCVRR